MPGGIPSGSDPTGWEAATPGSTPSAGYDPTVLPGAVVGAATPPTISNQLSGVTAGLSNLVNRTQAAVTAAYQELVQNNPTLTNASDTVFEGLNPNGTTPITTLLLIQIAQSFGVNISTLTTNTETLAAINAAWATVQQNAANAWNALEGFLTSGNYADLTTAWTDLMLTIFGSTTVPGLVGSISSSAVTNVSQNFQPVADFPNSASLKGGGGWSWSGTIDHTGTAGSGSAQYACDGTYGALDGVPAPVQAGQTVTPQAFLTWSGVTAAAGTTPFQLQLQPMQGNADDGYTPYGSAEVIAGITSPAASATWTKLTGTYTVPTDGSVTAVRLKLVVTSAATAGQANWDDCTANLSGGWLAELESDMQAILASFGAGGTAAEFTAGITGLLSLFGLSSLTGSIDTGTIWSDVINDIINPLNLLATSSYASALNSAINQIGQIFNNEVVTPINTAVQQVVSWFDSLLGWQSTTTTNHQSLTDAVNQGVTGTSQTGANAAAVLQSVGGFQSTVAGLQTQVTTLQTAAAGPTTVLADNGQSNPGTGLGSAWTLTGGAYVNRTASYGFEWNTTSLTAQTTVYGIYNTPLATNDQVGTIVLNALMSYNALNPSNYYQFGIPYNEIILRADTPTNPKNYVFARVRFQDVQFGYCIGGTKTLVGSPVTIDATAASAYTFQAGNASSDYNYAIVALGRTIATWADTGHLTSSLVTNRYSGQSWTNDYNSSWGATTPAATSWQSYDASASAGVPPGFGHITRINPAVATMTSGFLDYTFFDTQVHLGSGITLPTSGNCGFIVGSAGLYTFSYGLRMNSTSNSTDLWPGIAVNGVLQEVGPTFMYDGGGTILDGGNFGMASAGILCNANDLISPWQGLQSGQSTGDSLTGAGGSVWCGDSTGNRSYMKIAKIG